MGECLNEVALPVAADDLWRWLMAPGALRRLVPPWAGVTVLRADPVADGAIAELRIPVGPGSVHWIAEHHMTGPREFVDIQRTGPFAAWVHRHRVISDGAHCRLRDEVRWQAPAGLGFIMDRGIAKDLRQTFAWRAGRIQADLERISAFPGQPLRIAVSGAGGLVGSDLCAFLRTAGHTVLPLQRSPGVEPGIAWDARARIDAHALATCDAVVHLAGEPVAQRWSTETKRRILVSRVESTRLLARTMAALPHGPRVLVMASGISFAGDAGETLVDETAAQGDGFLPEVVAAWEQAADAAGEAGIRVAHLRIGMVLDPRGGALKKLLPPFSFGLGGPLGDGRMWMPWISLDDLVYLVHRALRDPGCTGVLNAVAPTPVRSTEFATTLGRVLGRPAFLPAPAFALRAAFGAMADELLLASCRAVPARLTALGHVWQHPELPAALRDMLGRASRLTA